MLCSRVVSAFFVVISYRRFLSTLRFSQLFWNIHCWNISRSPRSPFDKSSSGRIYMYTFNLQLENRSVKFPSVANIYRGWWESYSFIKRVVLWIMYKRSSLFTKLYFCFIIFFHDSWDFWGSHVISFLFVLAYKQWDIFCKKTEGSSRKKSKPFVTLHIA